MEVPRFQAWAVEEVNFPFHEHPLHRSGGYGLKCHGCRQPGYTEDGYRCSECYGKFFIHKECAESPLEINHSCHPQHPLNLVGFLDFNQCHLCHGDVWTVGYRCSTCDLWLHTSCSRIPTSHTIQKPEAHEHSLTLLMEVGKTRFTCHVCGLRWDGNYYRYACKQRDFFCHIKCVSLSPEINHLSHPSHPLQLLKDGAPLYSDGKCCLCGKASEEGRFYHCSACNYSLDLDCVRNPPPLTHISPKTHEHELTLIPRHLSFTCNACGKQGDRNPYVCLQCNFMIHRSCFELPLLININRHDHRISRTYLLGLGFSRHDCAVCHKKDVWDGRELIGKPEETEDIEPPFRVIDDNLINHFTHEEHNLSLNNKAREEGMIECKACIRPVYSDPFYGCMQCDYVLHQTCANLPRTKRHPLSADKLTLVGGATYFQDSFQCYACLRHSTGFRYRMRHTPWYDGMIDVECISITEPLKHDSHPHPLYYYDKKYKGRQYCEACGGYCHRGFRCIRDDCEFYLDYGCAVLPKMVEKHKVDDHSLFQCYGENAKGEYWCDICEEKVDPKRWFYTCDHCSTTLHINCVLGDMFSGHAAGSVFTYLEREFQVVANNGISRPYCHVCKSRCKASLILKTHDGTGLFICSYTCFHKFMFT
ncbi:PREDICTED: uncharacterized protein LOC104805437 isoform X2 [Tarenaya hassleriana]|uniref:uncharacterized protein LOC104805437 isoform X2 n=1 Tax=Tarenaya hassleriana TaxID=28532 RepID=UPI00053C41D9|nr:PREDICTED: uncharacterized protein LOC104805437 isoform X2 [Tarenaya hassleriana]